MAFKLPPHLKEKVDAEMTEMKRLYALPDRWLAEELLRLARTIRERTSYAARDPKGDTYNSSVVWDFVPEIAYRLGGKLQLNESIDPQIKMAKGEDLRMYAAAFTIGVAEIYFRDARRGERLCPVDILFHNYCNGSPIMMAVDRLAPPSPESEDSIARQIREIAAVRGHEPAAMWHPGLQEKVQKREPDFELVF